MRVEVDLDDDTLDALIQARLDYYADNMESYLHTANILLKDDIKDYKMLVRAANYFKVPSEQRKPLKFIASAGSTGKLRKKGRND